MKLLPLFAASGIFAHALQCPQNIHGQASAMIASNIARHQDAAASSSGTGLIELGIFYQALRESIVAISNTTDKQQWATYLRDSVASAIPLFTNVTASVGLPLDRFSIGTEMIYQWEETGDEALASAISALQDSLAEQPRNDNGGLWYYDNRDNMTAYRNLSYTDGMFSYPSFAILSTAANQTRDDDLFGPTAVQKQLDVLSYICDDGTGLLVHGYDALRAHSWADSETGASPTVWGRSLAWYTLGVLNAVEVLQSLPSSSMSLEAKIAYRDIKLLFNNLIKAQLIALERGLQINGRYSVWQVMDLPGASINGSKNFVETSASLMTAYSLLRSVRLNVLQDTQLRKRATKAGIGLWENIYETQVTRGVNGSLNLSGTSSIASLSGQSVDAKYYFDRPTVDNSLIGTSAFVLASMELEKLCE
ncbi:Six-hairpin glycosidase [Aureobasidium sp. EXF-8846]|nr:Six-hairpin glycosidase [Aureobasidium sp. EXF-8846]